MKTTLALFLALGAFASGPPAFEQRKAAVRALLDRDDFQNALPQAQSINHDWPDDVAGYQLVAAAQLGLGNYAEAETAIQWMLDLREGKADSGGWLLVARLREATGDLEGALDAINLGYSRLAPGQDRRQRELLAYSAHLQRHTGKLDVANRVLQMALKPYPDDPTLLEELARLRMAQGNHAEALQILRKLDPDPRRLYAIASLTGDPSDYQAFEQAARRVSAGTSNANRELVMYYAGRGDRPAEALSIARREAGRRHDVFTLDALAVAYQRMSQHAGAVAVMTRILATGTQDPGILRHAREMGVQPQ